MLIITSLSFPFLSFPFIDCVHARSDYVGLAWFLPAHPSLFFHYYFSFSRASSVDEQGRKEAATHISTTLILRLLLLYVTFLLLAKFLVNVTE